MGHERLTCPQFAAALAVVIVSVVVVEGRTSTAAMMRGASRAVLSTETLGFMWNTEDPFLFCVVRLLALWDTSRT